MSEEKKQIVVRYNKIEYPIITGGDLTEREKFEAERLSGCSLDALGKYTAGLLMAYFTLRRAGSELSWDDFLDKSGFEIGEARPLEAADAIATESGVGDNPTEPSGTQASPPSSASTPG